MCTPYIDLSWQYSTSTRLCNSEILFDQLIVICARHLLTFLGNILPQPGCQLKSLSVHAIYWHINALLDQLIVICARHLLSFLGNILPKPGYETQKLSLSADCYLCTPSIDLSMQYSIPQPGYVTQKFIRACHLLTFICLAWSADCYPCTPFIDLSRQSSTSTRLCNSKALFYQLIVICVCHLLTFLGNILPQPGYETQKPCLISWLLFVHAIYWPF